MYAATQAGPCGSIRRLISTRVHLGGAHSNLCVSLDGWCSECVRMLLRSGQLPAGRPRS